MLITLQQLKTSLNAVKSYVDKILPKKVSDLDNDTGFITNEEISGKVDIEDLASVATSGDYDDLINKPTIPVVPVTDVQINETSILSEGIAEIPIGGFDNLGVFKISRTGGLNFDTNGLKINYAVPTSIKAGTNNYYPITPGFQHTSIFYGLAKAAGDTTQSNSDNTVGTYTDEAKTAIKTMLGIIDPMVSDVQMDGTSIITNGIANIPKGGYSNLGVTRAASEAHVKSGDGIYTHISPSRQHEAVFYGLTKAAGVDMASSSNAVGTYTDAAKIAIKTMLGVTDPTVSDVQINGTSILNNGVANISAANENNSGVVKVSPTYGLDMGTTNQHIGFIRICPSPDNHIKNGEGYYSPITASKQHQAVFYGLAKAAGDATQSASSNAVGTYTDNAKTAIKTMLGVPNDSYDLSEGELLPANASLIDYTTPGIYYADDSTAGTISTCPTDLRFKLIVEKINDRDVRQTVIDYMGRNFTTVINTVTHDVSMWNRVATNDDLSYLVSDVQINGTSIVDEYGWANIPVANNTLGVVKVNTGTNSGIYINPVTGEITTSSASIANIKEGTNLFRPLSPGNQHGAAFYGLAKAAGDTTQAQSDNAIGTYTANAKTSIQNMLGIPDTFVTRDSIDGAGISSRTYTTLIDETVTTVSESTYLNPHTITVGTCNINKHYMHRITIGNDVYILPCQLWWLTKQDDTVKPFEYIGNIGLYTSDISYVPNAYYNVPFIIFNGGMNGICTLDIMTQIAGEYHIKIEKIENTQVELPLSLVHGSAYYPIGVINGGENAVDGVSIGPNSISYGSFAFGVGNECLAGASFAFGQHNKSLEQMAFTEGFRNTASGVGSHAEGQDNIASGILSHAEGQGNTASGAGSHAEGGGVTASGIQSHAENAITIASGDYSHSEGMMTTASGGNSHAEGQRTVASGQRSHAQGWRTIAQRRSQSVLGEANIADTYGENTSARGNYIEIVGNGTSDNARSNARTLDWNGNEYLNGNIYVNCNVDSTGGNKLISEVDYATENEAGIVKVDSINGIGIESGHKLYIEYAPSNLIKSGTGNYRPITPPRQHEAVFYGLAKAAGDTTQSQSSNTVGTFTEEAKKAIRQMLGIPEPEKWELINEVTADQDCTELVITTDLDGSPFELKKLMGFLEAGPSTTGTRDSFYGYVFLRTETYQSVGTSFPSLRYPTATSTMTSQISIEVNNGAPITARAVTGTSEGNTQYVDQMPKTIIGKAINGIKVYQSGTTKSLIPAGSKFRIYGIRL